MKAGPDIARVAALVGDPARANMLTALMSGKALTATELAHEAGVTPQTASGHLARLGEGGLVEVTRQGRHRYYHLAGPDVADLLERLMGVAARAGHLRTRTGPRDAALREARVCYDHLAGEMGVTLLSVMIMRRWIVTTEQGLELTAPGAAAMGGFGIDVDALRGKRRPVCRACLDWSARRNHLAGGLGAALLTRMVDLGWVRRLPESRALRFSPTGLAAFTDRFGLAGAA